MTKVIYISGVHGSGKTTIINKLAAKIQDAGLSVFTFPEMSYIQENIPIKTIEFQMWFKKQIDVREYAINGILSSNSVDYILADRHPMDIDVYTSHLLNKDVESYTMRRRDEEKFLDYNFDSKRQHFLIKCSFPIIKERLKQRSEFYRSQWSETEESYIKGIMHKFSQVNNIINLQVIENNKELEKAVDEIMRLIY